MAGACPNEDELLACFREDRRGQPSALAEHIAGCPDCSELLVAFGQLASLPARPAPAAREAIAVPLPGDRVGRYQVRELLGRGAMGVVYVAHDPDLERDIALKVVAPQRGDDADAQLRLLREAKAAARVHHPNIVTVHDCGVFGDRVFVAMELVPGPRLDAWLATPRSPRELLAVSIGIARGLAAAHRAGLVHHDVKPANIFIGEGQVAKLGDFGVAALTTEAVRGVRGTPAYMAPEVLGGQRGDARSDQFSLCVTLHEAWLGRRPFVSPAQRSALLRAPAERGLSIADDAAGLARAVAAGVPGRVRGMPPWLYRVLRRGLAARPEDRYATVDDVLARLERGNRAPRWIAAATAAAAIASIGAYVALREPAAERCPSPADELVAVWSAPRAATVRAKLPAGPGVDRIVANLDAYRESWIAAQVGACHDTRELGTYSEAVLDQRSACLARARTSFAALVDGLTDNEPDEVARALAASEGLPDLERCADVVALGKHVAPADRAIAAVVDAHEATIARAFSAFQLGHYREALAMIEAAIAASRDVPYRSLEADLGYVRGLALEQLGRAADAREQQERALNAARAAGDDNLEVKCSLALVGLLRAPATAREAKQWLDHAASILERVHDDRLRDAMLEVRGVMAAEHADYQAAATDFAAALALREKRLGPTHSNTALVRSSYGIALGKIGRPDEARAQLTRAVTDASRELGEHHPTVGSLWNNLGVFELNHAHTPEARTAFQNARAIYIATFGAEHPKVTMLDINLAGVAKRLGELDVAEGGYRAVLSILRKRGEGNGRYALLVRRALAILERDRGDLADAESDLQAVIPDLAKLQGPTHLDVASTRLELVLIRLAANHLRDIDTELSAIRALYVQSQGPTATALNDVDVTRAMAYAARADWANAAAIAQELGTHRELTDGQRCELAFVLAQVAWQRDKDRDATLRHTRDALAHLDTETGRADRDRIDAWLRAHRLPSTAQLAAP